MDMRSVPHDLPADAAPATLTNETIRQRILEYYAAATPDYKVWSPGFNMHFGYWRRGIGLLDREAMLHELNLQVLQRLRLPADRPARVADLGGGTGASARAFVAQCDNLSVDVVTIAPVQIELGNQLNALAPRGEAIRMHCRDYLDTGLPSGCYDGVLMIESACHSEGPTKAALLREAYRLLAPGGRLVMVDAMLVRPLPERSRVLASVYRRWCESWAVPEMCRLDLLPATLSRLGFQPPHIEDWSWRVVLSVAHVPLLATSFMFRELIKARGLLPMWRWRHIVASLLTPLLGLRRCTFTYSAVTVRKPER